MCTCAHVCMHTCVHVLPSTRPCKFVCKVLSGLKTGQYIIKNSLALSFHPLYSGYAFLFPVINIFSTVSHNNKKLTLNCKCTEVIFIIFGELPLEKYHQDDILQEMIQVWMILKGICKQNIDNVDMNISLRCHQNMPYFWSSLGMNVKLVVMDVNE